MVVKNNQHKTSAILYTRLITQSQHGVYKAGKLTIHSCKFLALPAVLVVFFSYNTLVTALIT